MPRTRTLLVAVVLLAAWTPAHGHAQSSASKFGGAYEVPEMARTPGVPSWGMGPGLSTPEESFKGDLSSLPYSSKEPGYGGPTADLYGSTTSSGLGTLSGVQGEEVSKEREMRETTLGRKDITFGRRPESMFTK